MDNQNKILHAQKNAVLVFPDGSLFFGYGIGKKNMVKGEICFNTSITGYQEILTDPSYFDQIINFTFPHIGNVGTNNYDIESDKIYATGLVIRENITNPSNYRNDKSFSDWLSDNNTTGISGVDTREITRKIRKNGASYVAIIYQDEITQESINNALNDLSKSEDLNGVELASKASKNETFTWKEEAIWDFKNAEINNYNKKSDNSYNIVAIDYGTKLNILRNLKELGFKVNVVGATTNFDEIIKYNPDGVFLSNGPGDPHATSKYSTPIIKKLIENKIPLFGICLGHQLLAIAVGAKTIKMKQGHRGANHPIKNLLTNKVEITSQNHGFCVDGQNLPENVEITHISLFDQTVAGLRLKNSPAFSVQYHPESSPGPNDSLYLFEDFKKLIIQNKKKVDK